MMLHRIITLHYMLLVTMVIHSYIVTLLITSGIDVSSVNNTYVRTCKMNKFAGYLIQFALLAYTTENCVNIDNLLQ